MQVSDTVKGLIIMGLGKVCAQSGYALSGEAAALVEAAASSRNADLQQRALEVQALLRCAAVPRRMTISGTVRLYRTWGSTSCSTLVTRV